MNEIVLDKNYSRGSRGQRVRVIQEWLCLNGKNIAIDGAFGPATEAAVREFQEKSRLRASGIVDANTYAVLIDPMTRALAPISARGKDRAAFVVAYANQHLQCAPREVGGQNRGPWVRLYLDGNEGANWPWCAGFVSFVLKQACDTIGEALPFKTSSSCDILAANSRGKGLFISGNFVRTGQASLGPGCLFLKRKTSNSWNHTGISIAVEDEHLTTIEGNTNDEGSNEGYEVCRRIRGYDGKDFIRI